LAIVVVPVLFENSFRKMKDDSDASELGVEPVILKRPTINSEVTLALRVLEGCCLLCKDCADSAYRYDAIKACGYINISIYPFESSYHQVFLTTDACRCY
jgi:hypothetical protein